MGKSLNRYRKLFDSLKGGEVHRLYFLYGPEEYLKKEFVRGVIDAALPEGNRAFNLDILYGDEFDRGVFDDRVRSFPLFNERRVVILRNFRALTPTNRDYIIEAAETASDGVVLIVETPEDRLDTARHKKLKKVADAHGLSFEFSHLDEAETVDRVRGRLEREGFHIDPRALDLLIESVGTQLIDLTNEVEKLKLAAGEDGNIDLDTVSQVVGKYRTESLFEVIDALAAHRTGDLVRRVGTLIDGGEEPVFILAMLIRRSVQLLEVRGLLSESKGSASRGRDLTSRMASPTNPYFAEALRRQAGAFETEELEVLLHNLRWADLKLKSTSLNPKGLIEEALLASHLRKTLAITGVYA